MFNLIMVLSSVDMHEQLEDAMADKRMATKWAVATLVLMAASTAHAQEGDPAKGKTIFNRCFACHTLNEGGPNRVGPNLYGVIGRQAGTKVGFNYSPAMKKAGEDGLVWSEETLVAYLENPRTYVPGNRMVFVGLPKLQDRLDVIAYIEQQTTPAEGGE